MIRSFLDTNILIYAFSREEKAFVARRLLDGGSGIGVQSLNEFVSVSRRKFGRPWPDIKEALAAIRKACEPVVVLDEAVHEAGIMIAERYHLRIYDALIAAAAIRCGCSILWSEGMQDQMVIEPGLRIVNPFRT